MQNIENRQEEIHQLQNRLNQIQQQEIHLNQIHQEIRQQVKGQVVAISKYRVYTFYNLIFNATRIEFLKFCLHLFHGIR